MLDHIYSIFTFDLAFFTTQFIVTLGSIFLRGVQTFNVIREETLAAMLTSLLMSVCTVASIGIISNDPYQSLIPTALGGAIGIACSIKLKKKKHVNVVI